ncbi:receptor-like serine/threonine-protein kinase SD1-8 [Iris pallida]|uniref:Receptor-like serine/threonine-protein kinase n=1 Tax=Iris pallida TaxID=29817 RepID=A0AAX6GM24_IRIPA|nr:receptor-like serine/threonine-protein kinase SD1-8 [Iris pallida]
MIQIETKGVHEVNQSSVTPCRNMQPYRSFFFFHIIIILTNTLFTLSIAARDTITPTQPLADNETLVSSDGSFALGFFTPSATTSRYVGIWYNKIPSRDIVWVANRGNPVIDSAGQLSVAANGTLIVTDQKSTAVIWSAAGDPTAGLVNPVAQLLDTGNFVVKGGDGGNGSYAWQGFDHPTDTLLPGMKLGVDRITGLNRTLRAWKSNNDPSPGEFYAAVDIRGDPEVYLWAGSTKQWRSGPSVGIGLSGLPDRGLSVRFVNDDREATYSQVVTDESIVSRVVVNQSGLIQHSLWSREAGQWNISWYAPTSGKCDAVGLCGAYGVCNADNSPALCQCLPGFVPSNQRKWDSWNWAAGGCVRRTNLTCTSNGTTTEDGFATVGGVKLPVSSNAVVDMSLSLEECEAKCLENCSCTAYASANISSVDGKKGCVMWVDKLLDISKVSTSGQDLHVRLSAADLASRNGRSLWSRISWPLAVTAMYVGGVSFTIYLTCVIRRYWSRRNRRRRELQYANSFVNEQSDEGANYFDLPIMDFATIEAATDNFSSMNKLGQGGYGPVYKGILGDSREIAVKRLAKTSLQGSEEFKNEVILIAKLQNRNLVQLLGCCIERKERMLIYEYMVNKSLDSFLFEKQISPFDWQTRYRIILGITRGLLYLHHDSRLRIIHRDLKASNILLDKDMNPKFQTLVWQEFWQETRLTSTQRKLLVHMATCHPSMLWTESFL